MRTPGLSWSERWATDVRRVGAGRIRTMRRSRRLNSRAQPGRTRPNDLRTSTIASAMSSGARCTVLHRKPCPARSIPAKFVRSPTRALSLYFPTAWATPTRPSPELACLPRAVSSQRWTNLSAKGRSLPERCQNWSPQSRVYTKSVEFDTNVGQPVVKSGDVGRNRPDVGKLRPKIGEFARSSFRNADWPMYQFYAASGPAVAKLGRFDMPHTAVDKLMGRTSGHTGSDPASAEERYTLQGSERHSANRAPNLIKSAEFGWSLQNALRARPQTSADTCRPRSNFG